MVGTHSWGWMYIGPTARKTASLQSHINRVDKGYHIKLYLGSPFLRMLARGHIAQADFMSGYASAAMIFRAWKRRYQEPPVDWHADGGPAARLRAWMRSYGWSETGVWAWKHDLTLGPATVLNILDGPVEPDKICHLLREGLRKWCVYQFWNSCRHDAQEGRLLLGPIPQFDARALARMKTWKMNDSERAVVVGAAVSDAWFARACHMDGYARADDGVRDGEEADITCRDCGGEVASFHHACWECPAHPTTVPKPSSWWQLRMGWPMSSSRFYNLQVLEHLANVRRRLLLNRYDSRV